jgi:hypothetical protein
VYVDPHVLSTPVIADIDGDGHEEVVLSVSYYYDREYYDNPEHQHELEGADISKYVAGKASESAVCGEVFRPSKCCGCDQYALIDMCCMHITPCLMLLCCVLLVRCCCGV